MTRHLAFQVHLHDRYHGMAFGRPEWPPSPARLFQALVAGAAWGRALPEDVDRALRWLETLSPPCIGAPYSKAGAEQVLFVPNNDLDAEGGDPAKVSEIRVKKRVVPRLFDGQDPLLFVWSWEGSDEHAGALVKAAERLYQLGRGVDLAWARAEAVDDASLDQLMRDYRGVLHVPSKETSAERGLQCPVPGSLDSLVRRFEAMRIRDLGRRGALFENAPKPIFRSVRYDRQRDIHVFELLDITDDSHASRPYAIALARAALLVVALRDAAANRLRAAFPEHAAEIERVLIGRKTDGRDGGPTDDRIRILPLPSIGHEHADLAIRRIAVEVPRGQAISSDDWAWAFDHLTPFDPMTGEETAPYVLVRADRGSPMLRRYGAGARRFHSVTPVVLPDAARRRRIEPSRRTAEAKGGAERAGEEELARRAVRTALRHAGVRAGAESITVQREPLERRGVRVEPFAEGSRFPKERLWHVDITFDRRVEGPLVLGDGRFLGLGVMAPVASAPSLHAFAVEGVAPAADPLDVTRALRRAVMARVQNVLGPREPLPAFISGHDDRGAPIRSEDADHLFLAFFPAESLIFVIPPHVAEDRPPRSDERRHLAALADALEDFEELRAGRAGLLRLRRTLIDIDTHPAFGLSLAWHTATPYQVTRHAKKTTPAEALAIDLRSECSRRGLPPPHVTTRAMKGVPRVGLTGDVEIRFARPVRGPLLLGRNRHFGGGLFVAMSSGGRRGG